MAGVRSFTGVYYVLYVRPKYPNARPFFDEINIARAFDIPVDWIAWPSLALVVLAWIIVVPRLTPDRGLKISAAVVGPILGILLGSNWPLYLALSKNNKESAMIEENEPQSQTATRKKEHTPPEDLARHQDEAREPALLSLAGAAESADLKPSQGNVFRLPASRSCSPYSE